MDGESRKRFLLSPLYVNYCHDMEGECYEIKETLTCNKKAVQRATQD